MFTPWTMKLSQHHVKSMIGCWTRPMTTSIYTRENVNVTMEFEVLKRHISRPTLFTDMVQQILRWERQKRCSGRKCKGLWQSNIVIIIVQWICFWEVMTRQDKTRKWLNLKKKIQNIPFWSYVYKSTYSLFGLHSVYIVIFILIFKKSNHGSWTIKWDHENKPSYMIWLHGPWCNPTMKRINVSISSTRP